MTDKPKLRITSVLKSLQRQDLVLPYFENSMLADKWPDKYTVEIDSSAYYGLCDPEGEVHETGAGDGYFHPSTAPLMSARELFYRFHPEYNARLIPERRTLTSHMTLAMGSALHSIVQTQMQMANLCTEGDIEVEYLNDNHNIRGRIDFIIDHPVHGKIIVELKTMNSYSYRVIEEIKPSWDCQLSLALTEMGHDFGILLLVEAGWPYNMREFWVRRNDGLVTEIYEKFHRVLESVELDQPPRCECGIKTARSRMCPARSLCWGEEG